MHYLSRVGLPFPLLVALLALVACDADSTTAPVPVMEDNIQRVTVVAKTVDVVGSCDHNSPFEGSGSGEFVFDFDVVPSGSAVRHVWEADDSFQEGEHDIGVSVSFNRNVTQGEDFILRFTATEYDGLLGADPNFNGVTAVEEHAYASGSWGSQEKTIILNGNTGLWLCQVNIVYTVRTANTG